MKRVFAFFMKGQHNKNYYQSVINGLMVFIFAYLLLELVLWITLYNNVYDRGLLALMLFVFSNLLLFAVVSFYLWISKNYCRDIEGLLPDINRYQHMYFSFQDEILLEHILRQLLKGRYAALDYEEYFAHNTFLNLQKEYRIIIFVPENEYDHVSKAYQICSTSFKDISKDNLIVHMLEIDHILVGICFPKKADHFDIDKSWLEMSRYMNYAQVKVAEKFDIHLSVAAGGRHSGLAGLKHGFFEAFEAYQYQKIYDDENSLIFYNNIKFEDKEYYSNQQDTWHELERKFLYCINIEDFENGAKVLHKIIGLIGSSHHQDFQMIKYKVFGLINSLYINLLERKDVGADLSNFNAIYQISNCKSIMELQSKTRIIYKAIEERLTHEDQYLGSNQRIREIANFMRKNYSNPDLNMIGIGEEFKISPAYLSRLFKKEMGLGPAMYLQGIRIDAAKELLTSSEQTIKEISEAVGYQYVLTLNRAFKKSEGITPTEYIAKQKYLNGGSS